MIKTLKLFYFQNLNFGDALNYLIFNKLSKLPISYTQNTITEPHIIGIGSIANWATPLSTIWGSGLANKDHKICPSSKIHLLRGPVSVDIAHDGGNRDEILVGDPALLIPKLFPIQKTSRYKFGIIPHYVDQSYCLANCCPNDSIKIIDVLQPVMQTIEDITSCENIISSSLHGLIVADAFGIPNAYVKMNSSLEGDGIKFLDYFVSVGRWERRPYNFDELLPYEIAKWSMICHPVEIKDLTDDILKSVPFEMK